MSDPFLKCLEFSLRERRLLSQKLYDMWSTSNGYPRQKIDGMSAYEVELFYRDFYWNPIDGPHLEAGVNLALFDLAIDAGAKKANHWRGTYLMHGDVEQQIHDVCDRRLTLIHRSLRQRRWIREFVMRVERCRTQAVSLWRLSPTSHHFT